ncbi:MAG: C4-dicarboxylic acid transporter DauA [Candidatus Hydrogenedens sp.]|nr:C4-dicarboxylic acid transporter DauA [Candidatus Hydrogenedens sp.]
MSPKRIARSVSSALLEPAYLGTALRQTFREGYGRADLLADLSAGAVVGIIAIPLSMALAIATGVPPQMGLYTAIVAGALTALLGGSRVQVTGPTAAFIVILAPVVHQFGVGGLMLATGMAGVMLFALGFARMGRLIQFVPYPVTAGFTAGIGIVIGTLQVKDFLGLHIEAMPEEFLEKALAIAEALPTAYLPDCLAGAATLALLLLVPRVLPKFPAPLVVLPVVAGAAYAAALAWPDAAAVTINDRFSYTLGGETLAGIPRLLPPFMAPWNQPGPDGAPLTLSLGLIKILLGPAFAIAILAAIESLLSAVIADGLTGKKHDPDSELMGLGLGSIAGTFFGGIAATGAIARTAANVRFGARSPIASITHALVILIAIVAAAPLLGYLPMASLAALLMLVAWNMSEARHVLYVLRIAPKSDAFVLLTCITLTVVFDMVVAVSGGLVLASVLFIRRMAEVSSVTLVDTSAGETMHGLRPGVVVYEIAGPLFFGAAEKAMSSLHEVGTEVRTVIFDFRKIPAMDVTGLINLQSAIRRLRSEQIDIVLAGVHGQPQRVLAKAGTDDNVIVESDFEAALAPYRAFESSR